MKTNAFLTAAIVLLLGCQALASITVPVQPWAPATGNSAELNLLPVSGQAVTNSIMGQLYGSWVQLPDDIQFWNPDGHAKATAKYAGYWHDVYYNGATSGQMLSAIASYSGNPGMIVGATAVNLPSVGGEVFNLQDVCNVGTWWSDPSLNTADNGTVHAVKFKILTDMDGKAVSDEYVVGFDDETGGGDRDFQDIVIQLDAVSTVPEPISILIWSLFGLGSVFGVRVWRQRRISVPTGPARRQPWSDENRMAIHQIIERGYRH
jgi:hypothetical protein